MNPDSDLAQQFLASLAPTDPHTLYAKVDLASESEFASADLLVQKVGSHLPFGLWFGEGLPVSADDEGFAPEAEVVELPDGSLVASLEQRDESDGEVYEIVRIVAAYRTDGIVVTINRYADPEVLPSEASWAFGALQALVTEPRWSLSL